VEERKPEIEIALGNTSQKSYKLSKIFLLFFSGEHLYSRERCAIMDYVIIAWHKFCVSPYQNEKRSMAQAAAWVG
jgi:hypothetical protein